MMRRHLITILLLALPAAAQTKSVRLADLSWKEAADVLTARSIVMIPLGAGSKEHGPHLKLSNDAIMADYLAGEVMSRTTVVVAPTVNYSYYPAFVEYPGATSLRLETARDLIVDICRGLAHFGPRKFYVLNTGVSTVRALEPAAGILAGDGIVMRYTDQLKATSAVEDQIRQEPSGTHADEIETSMMLYLAPKTVEMSKASKDFPAGSGPLQWRDPNAPRYSPSGIFGDATLASRAKGEKLVKAEIEFVVKEIEMLRAK
jgi:creatinine amidohydrolase